MSTTSLKSSKKPIAKTSKKITKFIRVPIDEKTDALINEILRENPLFSQLDAIRYIIGKQIIFESQSKRYKARVDFVNWLRSLDDQRVGEILSEDEQFQLLKDNDLM
jgi:hypothetical protein